MIKKGKLFIISAPSGCGKTTLCKKLLSLYPNLQYSISYTTRHPRSNEKNGVDYVFINEEEFKKKINEDFFLEWAIVYGDYYGTPKSNILLALSKSYDVLLDIDPQGAKTIKNTLEQSVTIFIIPPSLSELKRRLQKRKTESEELLQIRLKNVRQEIYTYKDYNYFVINDDFEKALKELEGIYIAEHCRTQDVEDINSIINLEE